MTQEQDFLRFNINDYIRVKLLDKGYQLLADRHNRYLNVLKTWDERNADYYRKKADSEGYTSFQAWDFMETFGSVTGLGAHGYYSTDILIEKKYLHSNEQN